MNQPLLSIIVPVYKSESYLPACIESILHQKYPFIELILVNDGSPDNSGNICDHYAQKDKRVKVIHKENGGQSSARNRGLEIATGDYITFVDSDDTLSTDAYYDNIRILEDKKEIDILQYPCYCMYGDKERECIKKPKGEIKRNGTNSYTFFYKWLVEKSVTGYICNKIFRKAFFHSLRFREDMIYEDRYILCEILEKTKGILLSPHGMYYYYSRPYQTTKREMTEYVLRSLLRADLNVVKHTVTYKGYDKRLDSQRIIKYHDCLHYRRQLASKLCDVDTTTEQELKKYKPGIFEIMKSSVPIGIKISLIVSNR